MRIRSEKRFKRVASLFTVMCLTTAMSVSVFANTTAVMMDGNTFVGHAYINNSAASYYLVNHGVTSDSKLAVAKIMWSCPTWTSYGGQTSEGTTVKEYNVLKISGTHTFGPKGNVKGCKTKYSVTLQNGKNKTGSTDAFK